MKGLERLHSCLTNCPSDPPISSPQGVVNTSPLPPPKKKPPPPLISPYHISFPPQSGLLDKLRAEILHAQPVCNFELDIRAPRHSGNLSPCNAACVCVRMLVCVYACICVRLCMCVCVYACLCVCLYLSTLVYVCVCVNASL